MDFKKDAFYVVVILSVILSFSAEAETKKTRLRNRSDLKWSKQERYSQKIASDYLSLLDAYRTKLKIIPTLAFGALNINNPNDLRLTNTPAPGIVNEYDPSTSTFSDFLMGLNFAVQTGNYHNNNIEEWLGFEIDYLQPFSQFTGVIHPRVNVAQNFDTVNFSYEIKSVAFLLNATLLQKEFSQGFGAYFNIGIGGAVNYLSNHAEVVPLGSTAAAMAQPFGEGSKGAFAFSVGLGLTETLANGTKVNFGYRYINTGHAQFDASPVQQTVNGLGTRALQSNLFNISLIV